MFYSQDDDDASMSNTPREIDFKAGGGSPMRKKRPPSMFKMFGRSSSTVVSSSGYDENQPPSLFNMMSQDSMASQSQFSQSCSQDFTDRMGNMALYSNADNGMSNLGCQFDGIGNSQSQSQLANNCNSNDAVAPDSIHQIDGGTNDAFSIPFRSDSSGGMDNKRLPQGPSMTQLSEGSGSQSQSSQPGSGFKLRRPSAFDSSQAPFNLPSGFSSQPQPSSQDYRGTPLSAMSDVNMISDGSSSASTMDPSSTTSTGSVFSFVRGDMPPPGTVAKAKASRDSSSSFTSGHQWVTKDKDSDCPLPLNSDGSEGFTIRSSLPADGRSRGSNNSRQSFPPTKEQEKSDKTRTIRLPCPMDNHFLKEENTWLSAGQKGRKNTRRPDQQIFISPFRERPRFLCDFEQMDVLGEGAHSVVSRARRRLDGKVYAVKKLKKKLQGEKEGQMVTREVCANAALQGCPFLAQYYGSWLEDGYLHIQTEACGYGTLEGFVGSLLPTPRDVQILMRLSSGSGGANGGDRDSQEQGGSQNQSHHSGNHSAYLNDNDDDDDDAEATQMPVDQEDGSQDAGFLYSTSQQDGEGDVDVGVEVGEEDMQKGCTLIASSVTCDIFADCDGQDVDMDAVTSTRFLDFGSIEHVRIGVPEQLAWVMLRDISKAVAFMHSKGIAHNDMRPANVFITHAPDALLSADSADPNPTELITLLLNGRACIRLGDLGQCCRLDDTLLNEGEARYVSREIISADGGATDLTKSDVFSLGATIYELLIGRQLGEGSDGALEWHSLRDGEFSVLVKSRYSGYLIEFLQKMLDPQPQMRPSAVQVCRGAENMIESLFPCENDVTEIIRLKAENEMLRRQLEE